MTRVASHLTNLFIVVLSLFVVAAVANLALHRGLHLVSLGHHIYLPKGVRALAQTSKSGRVPQNYLALVGDSNAGGVGDWLYSSYTRWRPPFHSAHVIHSRTNRDVISFGGAGGGSIRGLVTEPITQYAYLSWHLSQQISPPSRIFVYFYEGNDLHNNLEDLKKRFFQDQPERDLYDAAVFSRFLTQLVSENPITESLVDPALEEQFLLIYFLKRLAYGFWKQFTEEEKEKERKPWKRGEVNIALVDGSEVALPDRLQSPALELTAEEIKVGAVVFKHSLRKLREAFPSSQVTVIHLPSPLTSYQIVSPDVSIQPYVGSRKIFPRSLVQRQHQKICQELRTIAHELGAGFRDATWRFREASTQHLIHGPVDWKHPNRKGYEALAQVVIDDLSDATVEHGGCYLD